MLRSQRDLEVPNAPSDLLLFDAERFEFSAEGRHGQGLLAPPLGPIAVRVIEVVQREARAARCHNLLPIEPLDVVVRHGVRHAIVVGAASRRQRLRSLLDGRRVGQGCCRLVRPHRGMPGRSVRGRQRFGLDVVQAPVGEGHIHAEAGADLDQQRHEDGERRLHRRDVEAGNLGQNARLRIGLGHRRAAGRLGELAADAGDARFELLGLVRGGQLGVELVELLAEVARALAGDQGAFLGHDPVALGLEHVDLGGNGFARPMRGDPGQLLLGALGVGAQVLVGGGLDGALAGGVEPVECGVAQCRRHRVGDDDRPNESRCEGLRPHPVAQRGKEEERDERFEAVGGGRGHAVNLTIQSCLAETEAEPVVHRGGHDQQNAGRNHAQDSQGMPCH